MFALARRGWHTLVEGRRRYRDARGGAIAAALAFNCFTALFPALVTATAVVGFLARADGDVAGRIIDALGLHGAAADLVEDAVVAAAGSATAASIVGLAGLAWSGLGVFRALDEAFNAAWGAPSRGLAARLVGLIWLAGATVVMGASVALVRLGTLLPVGSVPLAVLTGTTADAALFLWSGRVFVSEPVPLRSRLPGAITFAVGMAVLKPLGALVVPGVIASSSALHGSLGTVFAVLLWLRLLAVLTVFAAALNAGPSRRVGT